MKKSPSIQLNHTGRPMRLISIFRSVTALSMFLVASALYASNPVIGIIDGVYYNTNYPRHHVAGWACAYGLPQSIAVHVYANGPAGVGHFVTAVTANNASDQAVANACGSTGTAYRFSIPLDGFLAANFGQSIYIHGISPNGGPNSLISNSGSFFFPDGITVNVFGDPMRIQTTSTLGGSIGSIYWRNKEFVEKFDHGREFQMAIKLNGYGECFNPNEAGSINDGGPENPSTSQVFTYAIPDPNRFYTGSYPAFWLRYDQTTQYCTPYSGPPGQNGGSQNPLSNFVFYKIVTAGYLRQNVIKVDTIMYIPYAVNSAAIESFTGYMNSGDFPNVMIYDRATGTATNVNPSGQTWQNKPLIFASSDYSHALGIYNPQINNANVYVAHYVWNLAPEGYPVNKWASEFIFADPTSGPYNRYFTNYLVIGTFQDVLDTMPVLYENIP